MICWQAKHLRAPEWASRTLQTWSEKVSQPNHLHQQMSPNMVFGKTCPSENGPKQFLNPTTSSSKNVAQSGFRQNMSAQNGLQHIKTKQKTTQTHALFQNPFDICDGSGVCKINARFTCTPDAFLNPPPLPNSMLGHPLSQMVLRKKRPFLLCGCSVHFGSTLNSGGAGV